MNTDYTMDADLFLSLNFFTIMIKHIVIWKLKEEAHGNTREKNARFIKSKIEGLVDLIPGIISMEVGIDFSCTDMSGDIVLYSIF